MEINGKHIGFAYTMRAYRDLSEICEGGDINKLIPAIMGAYGNQIENMCKFISVLINAGAHKNGTDYMTADEILDLDADDFSRLSDAAVNTYVAAQKRNVKATSKKKAVPAHK